MVIISACQVEDVGSIPSYGSNKCLVGPVVTTPDCKSGTPETPLVRIQPGPPKLLELITRIFREEQDTDRNNLYKNNGPIWVDSHGANKYYNEL